MYEVNGAIAHILNTNCMFCVKTVLYIIAPPSLVILTCEVGKLLGVSL